MPSIFRFSIYARLATTLVAIGVGGTAFLLPMTAQTPPSPAPTRPEAVPVKPSAPYVPTPEAVVTEMLQLADVKPQDVLYDLGSGDGRLVIAAVQKFNARRAVGIEINPGLVNRSQENAQQAGVASRVDFRQQDLFQADFRDASVVTLYLLPKLNLQLRPKLLSELKPGSRVVSHAFSMGDWKPDRVVLVPGRYPQRILYYWVIPANVGGTWQFSLTPSLGRSQANTIQLEQKFQQVTARFDLNGRPLRVTNLKLVGDQLSYDGTQAIEGKDVPVRFTGQVGGNRLEGRLAIGPQTYNLVAQRQ